MKKIIQHTLILAFVALFCNACSASRTAMNSAQVTGSDISGTWTVNNVSLDGFPSGYLVRNVFDMADYEDFRGSIWELNEYGIGSICLKNGAVQPIYWSLIKSGTLHTFQFKKIAENQRPKIRTSAHSLEFRDISNGTAVFKTPVTLPGGQSGYINFSFL
jgi:hypothetical protein